MNAKYANYFDWCLFAKFAAEMWEYLPISKQPIPKF
jgi:hypothetical protein